MRCSEIANYRACSSVQTELGVKTAKFLELIAPTFNIQCLVIVASPLHDVGRWSDGERPNGLAFSCRERAGRELQKTNDLAREAVSCNAVLGRSRMSFMADKRPDYNLLCAERVYNC
jgi:hypothetical protein